MKKIILPILFIFLIAKPIYNANNRSNIKNKVTFQFFNETGEIPLANAFVSFHEYKNNKWVKSWFYDRKIDSDGKIVINNLPSEFIIYIHTEDAYYNDGFSSKNLNLTKDYIKLSVPLTGVISFKIGNSFKTLDGIKIKPAVIEKHFKKKLEDKYIRYGGVGIFYEKDAKYKLSKFPNGFAKIQIKFNYEDEDILFEKSDIKVRKGQITDLGSIKLTFQRYSLIDK